jgi:putative ABC transport system permease protein
MSRLAWSQARFRLARTLALVVGMLVAATAFTVLTAASRTAQLRTTGEVSANFAPAYDILVRPRGTRTTVENETGTVQPDFLSGIYGGITMAQYRQVQQVPGVQVAAPIAMVGYAQLEAAMWEPVPAAELAGSGRQLYRISTTWVSDNGASRVTQPPTYAYVTPRAVTGDPGTGYVTDGTGPGCELGGSVVLSGTDPFGTAAQSRTRCWSRVNNYGQPPGAPHPAAGYWVGWTIPVLIAAVDPRAEAELDGLNKALVTGSYLQENQGDSGVTFPVLASSASGMNEYAQTAVQQLTAPSAMPAMNAAWASAQASVPGRTVATVRTTAQQAYTAVLGGLGPDGAATAADPGTAVTGYWSVGPVTYQRTSAGTLTPRQVVNPRSVWYTGTMFPVAMDDEDSQYRTVTAHLQKPLTQRPPP